MVERAQAEAKRLLTEQQVPALDQDQKSELDEIMDTVTREAVAE